MAELPRIDIEKIITEKLSRKGYRESFAIALTRRRLAHQIKVMRETRGWSQAELAEKINTTQSVISRLENPSYGKMSVSTIFDLAKAFDVWPSIEFVSFEKGLRRSKKLSRKALNAPSFKA